MKTNPFPGISGISGRIILLLALLVLPLARCLAQAATAARTAANAAANTAATTLAAEPEMADGLRQSGKIYVVVASVVIIVGGLLAYLAALDRKVGRLEKQAEE